jgi:hypothetical protein
MPWACAAHTEARTVQHIEVMISAFAVLAAEFPRTPPGDIREYFMPFIPDFSR